MVMIAVVTCWRCVYPIRAWFGIDFIYGTFGGVADKLSFPRLFPSHAAKHAVVMFEPAALGFFIGIEVQKRRSGVDVLASTTSLLCWITDDVPFQPRPTAR